MAATRGTFQFQSEKMTVNERNVCGMIELPIILDGIRMIFVLWREVGRLEHEIQFLRS